MNPVTVYLAAAVTLAFALSAANVFSAAQYSRTGGSASMRAQQLDRPAERPARVARPLVFEANEGQTDPRVKFLSRGPGYQLFLTPAEAVLVAGGRSLRVGLRGASRAARVAGVNRLPARVNYLVGNDPAKWHAGVPVYEKVRYEALYQGIDAVFYGNPSQLEYDFILAPGADAGRIRLAISGADRVWLDERGDAVLRTGDRDFRLQRPVSYQVLHGKRRGIASAYVLRGDELQIQVGAYDRAQPLAIDPVLVYSTYLGGSSDDSTTAIAVDPSGKAYVTGYASSVDFPVSAGALQSTSAGQMLAFVTKLDPTQSGTSSLVYSTYLGGSGTGNTIGYGIAVNAAGEAYVAGATTSSSFPAMPSPPSTAAAFQAAFAGVTDAFVSKLNAAGDRLLYSTYFGAFHEDYATAIAVDAAGAAYITGLTSPNAAVPATLLPTTPGVVQGTGGGVPDAFVAKFDPARSGPASLVYATYLGGSIAERGHAIAVDTGGNVFVTGSTASVDFPTRNPAQPFCNGCPAPGASDAFVTALNATATAYLYSTFLGGHYADEGFGIAVDGTGQAYVTGGTAVDQLPHVTMPITPNAFQPTSIGASGFVTRFDATGAIAYSSFFGRYGTVGGAIAVDAAGLAYVAGYTLDPLLPIRDPLPGQSMLKNSFSDAFVAKFDTTQSGSASRIHATYLGGAGPEDLYDSLVGFGRPGIAVDGAGNIYVTGTTQSTDFPITTATPWSTAAYQPAKTGFNNAYVAKIAPSCPVAPGTWTPTGSLAARRTSHTATRLANGKVLVAGGLDTGTSLDAPLSSALVYDPIAGTFSPTGSLQTPRFRHTATLLPNGKVLVAGGVTTGAGGICTNTAELYDPAANGGAGAFVALSPMQQFRADFTATLLPNGTVLLAGGSCAGGRSAEIFDPAANNGAGAFGTAGSMNAVRVGHSATLLPNGKVLVAGGADTITQTMPAAAEIYDSGTGAFAATGTMSNPRYGHTATLLSSGRVLVTGGLDFVLQPFGQAEIFDPSTGTFTATGSLVTARYGHSATRLAGGEVFVAGGRAPVITGVEPPLDTAELFDETAAGGVGAFVAAASMGTGRENFSATLLADGTVLAAGGLNSLSTATASAELFALNACEPPNTPPGTGVSVQPRDTTTGRQPVSVTFTDVSRAGVTSLTVGPVGPPLPPNFMLGTGAYYHIETTAAYFGSVTVCIDYSNTPLAGTATQPVVSHYDTALGLWVTLPVTSWDQANNVICGTASSLSPFALLVPVALPGLKGVMIGNVQLNAPGGRRHRVEFRVALRRPGHERGELRYRITTPKTKASAARIDRFESTAVGSIVFSDAPAFRPGRGPIPTVDSVAFSGEGVWNGAGGYRFEARATDAGEPGSGRDTVAVTVRDRDGRVVATVEGVVSAGNVQSKRVKR